MDVNVNRMKRKLYFLMLINYVSCLSALNLPNFLHDISFDLIILKWLLHLQKGAYVFVFKLHYFEKFANIFLELFSFLIVQFCLLVLSFRFLAS
jgi:hypothetical protein